MRGPLLALALALAAAAPFRAAAQQEPPAPGGAPVPAAAGGVVLNLGLIRALASTGHSDLAGVFTFVPDKDAPAAFAEFLVRNRPALKKYLESLTEDVKAAKAITEFDHAVVLKTIEIYGSPVAQFLEKPAKGHMQRLMDLAGVGAISLEELTSRRNETAGKRSAR